MREVKEMRKAFGKSQVWPGSKYYEITGDALKGEGEAPDKSVGKILG